MDHGVARYTAGKLSAFVGGLFSRSLVLDASKEECQGSEPFVGADVSRYSRFLYQRVRLLDKSVKVRLTADLLQENIAKEKTSSIE